MARDAGQQKNIISQIMRLTFEFLKAIRSYANYQANKVIAQRKGTHCIYTDPADTTRFFFLSPTLFPATKMGPTVIYNGRH